jgi:spectinomycin phosphotransferase/16S rRNA (guanine(1405)-N(7))-methyltransferase
MRTPPLDLTEIDVGAAVAARWPISAASVEYAAVGFGSHHWVLTEPNQRRWFVTADVVAGSAHRLAELTAALNTAHDLHHRCGLEFVVAPRPGINQELLAITGRYAIALYPYLERITDAPAEPRQILSMITALHAATPLVDTVATVDDLTIPDRWALEAVLADASPGSGRGPFSADFATLVREHGLPIRAALNQHDAMASTLGPRRATWVITHGEPKPNNTMITAAGPVLVDWDTVQLAPPAPQRPLRLCSLVHCAPPTNHRHRTRLGRLDQDLPPTSREELTGTLPTGRSRDSADPGGCDRSAGRPGASPGHDVTSELTPWG